MKGRIHKRLRSNGEPAYQVLIRVNGLESGLSRCPTTRARLDEGHLALLKYGPLHPQM